jgi:hypothetical protein
VQTPADPHRLTQRHRGEVGHLEHRLDTRHPGEDAVARDVIANDPSSRRWCTGVQVGSTPSTASMAPLACTHALRIRPAVIGAAGVIAVGAQGLPTRRIGDPHNNR